MTERSKTTETKAVFAITQKGEKSYWTKVGAAFFSNRDGSINLELDALPVSGKLQIRAEDEREERKDRESGGERRGRP